MGEFEEKVCKCSLNYSCNFSLNLKLTQNKMFLKRDRKVRKKKKKENGALYSPMPELALLNFRTTCPFSQELLPRANSTTIRSSLGGKRLLFHNKPLI